MSGTGHQTTNLGVGSSNLSGRARKINGLYPIKGRKAEAASAQGAQWGARHELFAACALHSRHCSVHPSSHAAIESGRSALPVARLAVRRSWLLKTSSQGSEVCRGFHLFDGPAKGLAGNIEGFEETSTMSRAQPNSSPTGQHARRSLPRDAAGEDERCNHRFMGAPSIGLAHDLFRPAAEVALRRTMALRAASRNRA
jgi:hypothetical protein